MTIRGNLKERKNRGNTKELLVDVRRDEGRPKKVIRRDTQKI